MAQTTRPSGPIEPLPILELTLRQFVSGKALRVVALFALAPLVFAAIYALDAGNLTRREFLDGLFRNVVSGTLLPLATLVLATNAIGNEIEDRTMVYLVLKPLSRTRIIVEKYGAVVVATTVLLWIGNTLAWLLGARGDAGDNLDVLVAMEIATLCGVLSYGALFLAASLIAPRALLSGVIYTLLWESTFSRFIPGVRLISVRHYVQSIFVRLADDAEISLDQAMKLPSALVVLAVVVVAALFVATFRLRTMNLE